MISLCIPTYNRIKYLKNCVKSIMNGFGEYPYEIVIVDGGSTDGTLEYLHGFDEDSVKVIEQGKLTGMTKAFNISFKIAKGDYIYIGNDDTILFPEILIKACNLMDEENQIGLVAPKDQETRHGNLPGVTLKLRQYWAPLSKFHIFRASALKEIGYYDENLRSYYTDDDSPLSILTKGYTTIFTKKAGMIHYRVPDSDVNEARAVNMSQEKVSQERKYLQEKWKPLKRNLEEYLEPYPMKRRKALYFAHFCSNAYHSGILQVFTSKNFYDWCLKQSVVFKDEKYGNLKDFYLAQKYPDEVI